MNKKYDHEGKLKHNSQGRYALEDNYYFTSGEPIEIFDTDDNTWLQGIIEYSHKYQDYYFCNDEDGIYIYDLLGWKARI
ncbi:DUF5348 domain-containing protein [Clostridium grantii]|uniref:DUF5348 domain-containing protein n=1 Tax=Clostridium grantii DSM 8605 TaxID=1121316 RepID=A0A1M5SE22_9CLOT|nr:DUF5348 domain-containing protein [Clostridium grantii]SHH36719.1 hypothetical protein SAMN02745207_00887 [Clostridium grantii DSM 8605]